jgi:hypothetical protein
MKVLQQVHRQWGWSPELVLQAAFNVQQSGWTELEAALQEGDMTDKATLARRHLERIRTTERRWYRWLQALARIMDHRWPFGLEYGAAVWNIPTKQASRRLNLLTQAGLLARLQDKESVFGAADSLWQVWPWVYALLPDVPTIDHWWQKPVRGFASAQVAQRFVQQSQVYEDWPWWLHLLGMLPTGALLIPEIFFVLYYKFKGGKRTWSRQTWQRYAPWFLTAAEEVQEQVWQQDYGITQEYWLLLALPYRTTLLTLGLLLGLLLLLVSFALLNQGSGTIGAHACIRRGFYMLSWLGKVSVPLSLGLLIWEATWLAWVLSQAGVETITTRVLRWLKRILDT